MSRRSADLPTASRVGHHAVPQRGVYAIYLICMLVLGALFAVRFTPMSGIDEEYHYKRALQVSEGHVYATYLGPNEWGGRLDRRAMAFEHWLDVVRNESRPTHVADALRQQALAQSMRPGHEMHWFPSTASYPPLPYAPAALGLAMARAAHLGLLHRLLAGRLASLAAYVGGLALIVAVLPAGRACALAVLTTPTALHLAASFSADPVSLVLPVLFAAWCIRLAVDGNCHFGRRHAVGLFGLGVSLGLLKLTCGLTSLLVLLVPVWRFRGRAAGWAYRVGLIVACCGIALLWNLTYPFVPGRAWHTAADPAQTIQLMRVAPLQALRVFLDTTIQGTHWWWTDAFSRFGGGPVPYVVKVEGTWPVLSGIILAVLLLSDRSAYRSTKAALLLATVAVAYFGMVLVAFRVGFSGPHDVIIGGLQGRYFLLPLALLCLGAALVLPRFPLPSAVGTVALACCLVVNIAVGLIALHRYAALWN